MGFMQTDHMRGDILLTVNIGDDNVVYLGVGGNVTDDHMDEFEVWAKKVNAAITETAIKTNRRALTLLDVSRLNEFDIKTTTIVRDLMVSDKDVAGKTAIFGANHLASAMLQAIIALTKRKNVQLFTEREEATAWLKEPTPESESVVPFLRDIGV